MSNLVTFSTANLPSVTSLSTALRALEKDVGAAGVVILKMDKTGHWVFGADQTEVEDGSTWAVNPFSFVHGYIAWGDGEVLPRRWYLYRNLYLKPTSPRQGLRRAGKLRLVCRSNVLRATMRGWKRATPPRL